MEKGSLQQKIISNMSEDKCYEKEKFRPQRGSVRSQHSSAAVKVLQKNEVIPFLWNLIHYLLTAVYTGYNLQSFVINKAVTHAQFPVY